MLIYRIETDHGVFSYSPAVTLREGLIIWRMEMIVFAGRSVVTYDKIEQALTEHVEVLTAQLNAFQLPIMLMDTEQEPKFDIEPVFPIEMVTEYINHKDRRCNLEKVPY